MRRKLVFSIALVLANLLACRTPSVQAQAKPNILVIMGDDIGYWNLSTYNQGMMGFRTPNIDSIANDGMKFTDAYAENSCTAGRSAFITGQSPFRTGLLKVGLPGAKEGLSDKDPTFWQKFGPRGVLHCYATDSADSTNDPRFGPVGKQKCEDTGQLTRKRMETVDEEFLKSGIDFIERANKAGKPFFVWFASTRMHIFTHLKPESKGKTGLGVYADGMVEHDGQVGELLAELQKLGVANNTILIYTTDNGAELLLWPDGGTTPFHGEKNTTLEGGFRVPMMVKWPGHVKPGVTSNDVISLLDWVPTLMAAAGQPDIKERLLEGY